MITGVSQITLPVDDKDRAKAFWATKIGFTVHTDEPYGKERWIELAPPEGAPLLVLTDRPEDQRPQREQAGLPDSPIMFVCDDIEQTHRELTERGVRFSTPPQQMPFGWWAVFEDDQGTRYGLGE